MNSKKWVALIGILVLLLARVAVGVVADKPAPQDVDEVQDVVDPLISYQGRLTDPDSGRSLTGTYDLEFALWTAETGGAMLPPVNTRSGETITNGLYRTQLQVNPAVLDGRELWLEIKVREAGSPTWETLSPRVEILPTVYAFSVRPQARVYGGVGVPNAILMATNTSSGWGLRGESRDDSGYGVYGYNGSTSSAAYGGGVIGITRTDGYGVRGEAPSSGDFSYGGYFIGRTGVRGYGMGDAYQYDYGGYFLGYRRGIYAASATGYHAGYFNGTIYVNGTIYPMLAGRTLVINGGDETLEPGDIVAISGVAKPLEAGGEPMLAVRKASGTTDTAVVGVVAEAMLVQEVEHPYDPPGQKSVDLEPVKGNVLPGGCLAIVTHGLVPAVKVSAPEAASLQVGDMVVPAATPGTIQKAEINLMDGQAVLPEGTILGKVAGPYDAETGTVPVFVTLR
jgi:hypothetical protein